MGHKKFRGGGEVLEGGVEVWHWIFFRSIEPKFSEFFSAPPAIVIGGSLRDKVGEWSTSYDSLAMQKD